MLRECRVPWVMCDCTATKFHGAWVPLARDFISDIIYHNIHTIWFIRDTVKF